MLPQENAADRPWNIAGFESAIHAPLAQPFGMLGAEERRMLHWVAREGFAGRGQIVDAGAFVGASAFALASGLAERTTPVDPGTRVHSYDYFSAIDEYVIDSISKNIRPIAKNESYLDVFERQISPYREKIQAYTGDFMLHDWGADDIGVLFVDICKTKDLNSHVVRQFFPRLIPGESYLIHQDFYHAWHPYIHITMQSLKDFFEVVAHRVPFQSKVYRLKAPIPQAALDRAIAYDFTASERLGLIGDLAMESPPPVAQMAQLIGLYQRILDRDAVGFWVEWHDFVGRNADADGNLPQRELWGSEAGRIHALAQRILGSR